MLNDLCNLEDLSQKNILDQLEERYKFNYIYTWIGSTLIVINPYQKLPDLYNENVIELIKLGEYDFPHTYTLAHIACKMVNIKVQSIVITGESGAGKTENAKYCLEMICSQSHSTISQLLYKSNPILESFGNSKTVRNSNSSRFGKLFKIYTDKNNQIKGGRIVNYLLEKSRVVHQQQNEGNFHIFYSMDKTMINCKYINKSEQMFQLEEINESFRQLNFGNELMESIYNCLKSIVYLGLLVFDDSEFDENSKCCKCEDQILDKICICLKCEKNDILNCLVYKKRMVGTQTIESPINKIECCNKCNSLAQVIYTQLFQNIVDKINEVIQPDNESLNYINILDIFGFENFQINSLEQFCINYANEKLQQLYISYIFKKQLSDFQQDGLNLAQINIPYVDNSNILQIYNQNLGLLDLLNEATTLKLTYQAFLNKVANNFQNHPIITFQPDSFTICHTQAKVQYNVVQFVSKNSNLNFQEFISIFNNSKNLILKNCVKLQSKQNYLVSSFKNEINDLMTELISSDVSFIRCVKPNEEKLAKKYDRQFVKIQIQYLGVFETITVRKLSYPHRMKLGKFCNQYYSLQIINKVTTQQESEICEKIISDLMIQPLSLVGKANVYFKGDCLELLNKKNNDALFLIKKSIRIIRKQYLIYKLRKNIEKYLKSIVRKKKVLTKFVKGIKKQIRLLKLMKNLKKILLRTYKYAWRELRLGGFYLEYQQMDELQNISDLQEQKEKLFLKKFTYSSAFKNQEEIQIQQEYYSKEQAYISLMNQPQVSVDYTTNQPTKFQSIHECVFNSPISIFADLQSLIAKINNNQQQVSIDKNFNFSHLEQKLFQRLTKFQYLEYIQSLLQQKITLFIFKQDPMLTFKNQTTMIQQSLIKHSSPKLSELSIELFGLLLQLQICSNSNAINILSSIDELIVNNFELSTEGILQGIQQIINCNLEQAVIKYLQFLLLIVHQSNPNKQILFSLTCFLHQYYFQNKNSQISSYILYVFPKIARGFDKNHQKYILPYEQMDALVNMKLIKASVYLFNGQVMHIYVEEFENCQQLKFKIMKELNIKKDLEKFYEIVIMINSKNYLKEQRVCKNENIWGLLRLNEIDFGHIEKRWILFKIGIFYEYVREDKMSIQLFFSQCLFDLIVNKYELNDEDNQKLVNILMKYKNIRKNFHQLLEYLPKSKLNQSVKNAEQLQQYKQLDDNTIEGMKNSLQLMKGYECFMGDFYKVKYINNGMEKMVEIGLTVKGIAVCQDGKLKRLILFQEIVEWVSSQKGYVKLCLQNENVIIESSLTQFIYQKLQAIHITQN